MDEVIADIEDLMEIPGPCEEDAWSDDKFDGYVESAVEDRLERTESGEMRDEG